MSLRGVPGPFLRLARQPLRAAAIALLVITAVASAGIQSAAVAALQSTLDANWRGVYDILVTPADSNAAIDGLLPPNSLSSTDAGMTLDDLAAVRAIPDVEVAAPIGEVLVPGLRWASATVAIPRGFVGATEEPQAFRVKMTYSTDDGLGERIVQSRELSVVVDEASSRRPRPDLSVCLGGEHEVGGRFGSYVVDPAKYPLLQNSCRSMQMGDQVALFDAQGWAITGDDRGWREPALSLQLPSAPQTITRVTLIDPIAERVLLGSKGAFLDPLVEAGASADMGIDAIEAWAIADHSGLGQQFLDHQAQEKVFNDSVGMSAGELEEMRQLFTANGDDWDEYMHDLAEGTRYAPLLIAEDPVANLSLKIEVEAFGAALARDNNESWEPYTLPPALVDGSPGTSVGTSAGDVSELLNPFSATTPRLAWPGADLAVGAGNLNLYGLAVTATAQTGAGTYTREGDAIILNPSGYTSPMLENEPMANTFTANRDPNAVGVEAAYAGARGARDVSSRSIRTTPVGSFSADDLGINDDAANYVPLGAYAPVGSTVVDGVNAGTTMRPNLTGLGLVSSRTAAVGSLASAALWGQSHPIDAIRVRVADIPGYTSEATEKVVRVAQDIEALGLRATIVAGSSPTNVPVQVKGYAFGVASPGGQQTVGPLGTVSQRWSQLGAAASAQLSVASATLVVLGIALGAAVALLGAVQLAGIAGRREQAIVMREIGFTRPRVARWFAGEEVPGILVVGIVAGLAYLLSGGTRIAALASFVVFAAVALMATLSVVAGSRASALRAPARPGKRRLGARSVAAFGARQALIHPMTTLTHVVAILIIGLAGAGLVAAIVSGRDGAGESSLAPLVSDSQFVPQVLLGGVGIAGGILLARLTRRLDLARRTEQWSTLRAAGWTSRELARAQRVEGLAIMLPALAVTGAVAWVGTKLLAFEHGWLFACTAVVIGTIGALLALSDQRKGTTQ